VKTHILHKTITKGKKKEKKYAKEPAREKKNDLQEKNAKKKGRRHLFDTSDLRAARKQTRKRDEKK